MADDRQFEHEIEIDAPPAAVWRALTEAQEIARWFAPDVTVELLPSPAKPTRLRTSAARSPTPAPVSAERPTTALA